MAMEDAEIEAKLLAYATAFLRAYTTAIDTNFPAVLEALDELGMEADYFPLHDRQIGKDAALAALFTSNDFYVYFLDEPERVFATWRDVDGDPAFSRDWTLNTPSEMRRTQVQDELAIDTSSLLRASPDYVGINIAGTNFMRSPIETMEHDAQSHGTSMGNRAGHRAESELPALRNAWARTEAHLDLGKRYLELRQTASISPQARGQAFERLWRDALEFHGWRPKKIRIPGEENDFTAIYQGLHILGEVRWYAEPMSGGKLREFLGKLDPRPQTIGLFVSHSGIDGGARSVIRRAVNSKTVVVFELAEIEAILVHRADIGPIFDENLRDAYDYIFEHGQDLS